MPDILDEVRESLQEERLIAFLKRTALVITMLAVVLLSVTVVISGIKAYNEKQIKNEGTKLYNIIQVLNTADSRVVPSHLKILEDLGKGSSMYAVLAKFYLAQIDLASSKSSKAILYYQEIADNASCDMSIRNYGILNLVNARLTNQKIALPDAVQHIDSKLLSDNKAQKGQPFLLSSLLLKGALQVNLGNKEKALESFYAIATQKNLAPDVKVLTNFIIQYVKDSSAFAIQPTEQ
ncbi:hypothetical protein MIDIC_240033 [Alphaproteobacteria bacterium]